MGTPSLPNPMERRTMMLSRAAPESRMRMQRASSDRNLQYMMDKRRTMLQRSSSGRELRRTPSDRKLQKTPSDRKLGSIGRVSSKPNLAKHKSNSMRNLMKSSTLCDIIQVQAPTNTVLQPQQSMLSTTPDMLDKRQMLGRLQRPSSLRNLMKDGRVGLDNFRSNSSGNLMKGMKKEFGIEPGYENDKGQMSTKKTSGGCDDIDFDSSPLDIPMPWQKYGVTI